jgi:Holliday junction resolvasome RuvABC endonuclease subunit
MRFIGIDYSLTSPSICIYDGKDFNFSNCKFYYLTDNKKREVAVANITGTLHQDYTTDQQRYYNITTWVLDKLHTTDNVFIEGYSLGSTGMVFNIAENTGLLKHYMWKQNIKFSIIPPTVIKKFATGKGNANKQLLQDKFIEETGLDIKRMLNMTDKQWNPSSDIIDSYYICKYGVENA